MDFKQAIAHLRQGEAVRRHGWKGYWRLSQSKNGIEMVCKDGCVIKLEQGDVISTVLNMCEDDWEVAEISLT